MAASVNVRVNSRAIPTFKTPRTTTMAYEVKEAKRFDSKSITVILQDDRKITITKHDGHYSIANNVFMWDTMFFREVDKMYNDGLNLILNADPHTMLYIRALELAIEKDDATIVESMLRIEFTEIQKIALLEALRRAGNPESFRTLKEYLR